MFPRIRQGSQSCSWNDHEPEYDTRDWSEGHEKLGKGVTLTGEEIKKLRDILNAMEL